MDLLSGVVVGYVSVSMIGLLFHPHLFRPRLFHRLFYPRHHNLPPEPVGPDVKSEKRVLSLSAASESLMKPFSEIAIDVLSEMMFERMPVWMTGFDPRRQKVH